jgi:NAD(P)-dependent dehydrogenase (short-subunit alcohol dehydrogenase family)
MSAHELDHEHRPSGSGAGCAIVTGGSRGLGLAIAGALAATGRPVVIAARGEPDLRDAATKLKAAGRDALAVPTDITDAHAVGELVLRAVERYGQIDVLVNNAGALPVTRELDRLSWEAWRQHIDVDVRGVFNTGQHVGPLMRQQGHGTIINIASAAAIAATGRHVSYSPAQAAIIALSRCMNGWLAEPGVAVHALCPDLTPAGGVGRAAATAFAAEGSLTMEEWLERRFAGSLIDADDVGAAVVQLTGNATGGTWFVGVAGLEDWSSVLSLPVAA